MINLLPYEDKKKVEREALKRFAIVALSAVSFTFLFGIIAVSPLYFSLRAEGENLLRAEKFSLEGAPLARLKSVEGDISKLNLELAVLESAVGKKLPSDSFRKIINSKPAGISIAGISFRNLLALDPVRVSLSGKAAKREDLVLFQKILEDSGLYKKIDSPISNILKKNDIEFVFDLEFSQ